MPKRPIRGVLFDKDGTLFDFHATWSAVIEGLLDELAPSLTARRIMAADAGFDEENGRFVPGSAVVAGATSEVATLWAEHRPDLGPKVIETFAKRAALAVIDQPDAIVPAARDLPGLLARLKARGLALGVATHDAEDATREQLAAVDAADAFDFVAGYDSGFGLKPAPDMLFAFAEATGIDPASVAMVGDSRHDLEIVPLAGAAVAVGVLTGPAGNADLAPYADHILTSIDDLEDLLDRLG